MYVLPFKTLDKHIQFFQSFFLCTIFQSRVWLRKKQNPQSIGLTKTSRLGFFLVSSVPLACRHPFLYWKWIVERYELVESYIQFCC